MISLVETHTNCTCDACYCDADWGGDLIDNKKSHTGYLIYIGGTLLVWSSKKLTALTRSNTEAEYKVVATAVEEAKGVPSMLTELGVKIKLPMKVLTDNLSQQDETRSYGLLFYLRKI